MLCVACSAPPPRWRGATYAPTPGRAPVSAATLAALGRAMFFDPSLSASGRIACASCHDPAFAFGPGPTPPLPGPRAVPSLRYLQTLPPFSEHFFDNDGNDSIDAGPTGGHTWDGRATSAHAQARLPLLSPTEMANRSPADVVARLARSTYAARMQQAFGDDVFSRPQRAFDAALLALEVFQQTPAAFYPYSSHYDAVLRGQARLNAAEARGLALFNDPAKGNCVACHPSAPSADGAFPLFTDFGFVALGVPAAPGAAGGRDLGLCGPLRSDFAGRADYCGLFRTPTLRNVALRRSFFHNGVFHALPDVLRFYAARDTEPERFYAHDAAGRVLKFDDLPAVYQDNVNREPPFGGHAGGPPALTEAEIEDIAAFLRSLTDADLLRGPGSEPLSAARPTARGGARAKLGSRPPEPLP